MALTPSIIGPTSRQYFADLTNSVLMQGRLEADDAWRQAYHSQMAKTWAYYGNNRGEMEGDIRKKANEHPADYANKPKSTIALVDRAVQQYVANVYGLPVLRTVPNYPEFEKQIIEINHGVPDRRNVYRKLQIATEIAGTSFVIPRIRSNGQLDFDIYTMDQMYPTLDPLTGELVGMALETVLDLADTSITRTEAWTNDGWIVYEDGKLLEQGDNPYGRIPGVVFRAEDAGMLWWGSSRAMKLVDANRDINEMRTDLRALTTDQAASLLVITGVDGELGDEVLAVVGANRYTTLPEGCDAKYIMPDVPTDKILQVLDSFIDQALRDGALITITKDGKSPESGFGMVVR